MPPERTNDEILDALEAARGIQRHAAAALGWGPSHLHKVMKRTPVLQVAWGRLRDTMAADGRLRTQEDWAPTNRADDDRLTLAEVVAVQHDGAEVNQTAVLARVQSLVDHLQEQLDNATPTNLRTTLAAIRDTARRGLGWTKPNANFWPMP